MPVTASLPVWPGEPRVKIEKRESITAGDQANVSHLSCGVHTGTHVDAPLHFIPDGNAVDELPLEVLIGPARVVSLPDVATITPLELEQLNLPPIRRLLLRTRNSELWQEGVSEFKPDYVALTSEAAAWIVSRGIELIGVDYLSVQLFHNSESITHRILLEAGVIIVEGIDLSQVSDGEYYFIGLPLRLAGVEGSPARVVLLENGGER